MPAWSTDEPSYFPILNFKAGEFKALENLPNGDKERLKPLIALRPANGTKKWKSLMASVRRATGERPFFVDLCPEAGAFPAPTEAKQELNRLASAADNFGAWRTFIEDNEDLIPVIRTPNNATVDQVAAQVAAFEPLERGMALRLRPVQPNALDFAQAAIEAAEDLENLLIYLDIGQIRDPLTPLAASLAFIEFVAALRPDETLNVVNVATSFPFSFEGDEAAVEELDICERQLTDSIRNQPSLAGQNVLIHHGDYASGRAEERNGFRGPPRVDYATRNNWFYSRQHGKEQDEGLPEAASSIMEHECWDDELNVWGAQRIRDLAVAEDDEALKSFRWASAIPAIRINLHLHAQINNGGGPGFYETDDEWED